MVDRWVLVAALGLAGCERDRPDPPPFMTDPPPASATTSPVPGVLAAEDTSFVDTRSGWGWSDRCWGHLQRADGAQDHRLHLDHARAACLKGLALAPDPGPADGARPSLIYNLGLVEERSGNLIEARRLFERSLALRSNDDVAAALRRVGGTPGGAVVFGGNPPVAATVAPTADVRPLPTAPAGAGVERPAAAPQVAPAGCAPCATQEDFDAVMKSGLRCCPVIGCRSDADCSGGRVCCRIPDGQLCGDAPRCTAINRVDPP